MAGPVHYEIYVRKTPAANWTLLMASEDRRHAITTAEEVMRDKIAASVKVTKETLNPATMEFASVSVLRLGAPDPVRKKPKAEAPAGPACRTPADLYTVHARESLGRVLEDWLRRQGATVFELLHSPVLAERLDASGVEVQHAIQKVAVPEAQATGQDLHGLIRTYQKLSDQAVERVIRAGRKGDFIDPATMPIARIAEKLQGEQERAFRMGGSIALALQGLRGSRARLTALLDLCDQAPESGPLRAMILVPIEQILCEMLAARWNLPDLFGPSLDQGATLAAVVRMVAPNEVTAVISHDPRLMLLVPPVDGPAVRLGEKLAAGSFPQVAAALAKMVLSELNSQRRLCPGDAEGEINILRALAMSLTATAGRLLTLEEVQNAFIERSRSLVTADFVGAYVQGCPTVMAEAEKLARLSDNVTGGASKRAAARWLEACVASLRFEAEMRAPGTPPTQKLAALRRLQRSIETAGLAGKDAENALVALGNLGTKIAEESRLLQQITKAPVPLGQRLSILLKLASGEAAPVGKLGDLARAEIVRLVRTAEDREALKSNPELVKAIVPIMKAAGVAA
ncbi:MULTISPECIES: hypothetical protein [unclassified Brevundimonas]|uniref:hypothetical protein n=1 Tax=unclassified Brevundimonas TaxID=2622653 RepID=UPI0025BE52BF|nr:MULTISPECIES: hypothetical protein [unclassified Brevundimonas]